MSRHLEEEAAELFPVVTIAGRDYKAWAKRLLWRDEQGDKSVTMIQVKFASEALNIKKENT